MIIIIILYYIDYIGRAAFASEENETLDVPTNGGGSVNFNATVIYSSGGSCNYQQTLILIRLRKINETTGETLNSIITCRFDGDCHWPCHQPSHLDKKISANLSRGDSGSEFGLTLFNITADSVGTYEVIVESSHPGKGDNLNLVKKFHLVGK